MNIADAYAGKFLKASDFTEDGTVMTIREVQMQTVGQGEQAEVKPVIYFVNEDKGLVCNKTNGRRVAKMYGTETDDWEGKKVTVFQDETDFAGDTVPCIRIKTKPPSSAKVQEQAKANQPIDESDIPF